MQHLEAHVLSELRHRYNAFAPIHRYQRLPPEVLLEILSQVEHTGRRDIRLMHVCQTWRSLLMGTPEFWARMLAACPLRYSPQLVNQVPEWFDVFLHRSAPAPLALTLPCFHQAMQNALMPHAYHIHSLAVCIAFKTTFDSLYTMLSHGLASLASLCVTHDSNYPGKNDASSYRALHWSDETLPRLRTLRLPSIFLSPGFSVLSLRDVEIRSCDCYVCRNRSEKIVLDLPSFLKRCPFLDTLRLVGGGPLTLPHGSDSSVVLTALRVLHFGDHDVTEIRELISRITVSPRTTVTIDVKYGYPGASVQVALQSVPIFSMADKIVVRFCTGDFAAPFSLEAFQEEALRLVIYAGRRRPVTTLTPSRDAITHGALAGLALSLPSLSVTTLELWHIPSWVSLDEYFSLLKDAIASLQRLAVLTLHLEDGIAFRPMRLFRRTCQGSPIVCPVLHTFEVSWSIPVDYALNMFIASCARLRNALNERSVVENPLEVFSLTCAHTRHLQGPGRTGEAAVRKRLEKLFAGVAGEVQVTTYSRRDPTGQCP
ncbi:uncharacterized protein TRAVEDRAFT_51324 [Trametes versicolor FP-101664 SS1]|uniref:uncharacterized protein n=1 Tax=Trametes versicolor (strain FP-101664) TaxID=717944 RepID=UPI0004622E33|nr:uncharacterized protein TRAVEDRAFT_51324 [Trametes versicolor FP-101664 SS1]EIW55196.1 hypothetical protein TRAVEDRAFT_51324 [Trametes versicolor FP-101664 SS1]